MTDSAVALLADTIPAASMHAAGYTRFEWMDLFRAAVIESVNELLREMLADLQQPTSKESK